MRVQANPVDRMEALGRAGLTVYIRCGPRGDVLFSWNVVVLSINGEEFDHPFAADSFEQAIQIAEAESIKRGWVTDWRGYEKT